LFVAQPTGDLQTCHHVLFVYLSIICRLENPSLDDLDHFFCKQKASLKNFSSAQHTTYPESSYNFHEYISQNFTGTRESRRQLKSCTTITTSQQQYHSQS